MRTVRLIGRHSPALHPAWALAVLLLGCDLKPAAELEKAAEKPALAANDQPASPLPPSADSREQSPQAVGHSQPAHSAETEKTLTQPGEPPLALAQGGEQPSASSPQAAALPPPGPTSWPSYRNGPLQRGVSESELPEKLELLWKMPVEYGVPATAAIVGDHVYVGAMSGDFYCLDKTTGTVVWNYRSAPADENNAAPGFKAPPTVTADTVYVGEDFGGIHAIDRATGKKRWSFQTGGEVVGGAAVVGSNVIVGSHDNFIYCLNAADGSLVWKLETGNRIYASPAVVENVTFVAGCDELLRIIDVQKGEQVGDINIGSYVTASPAILGEMLYLGTHGSEVLAINWKTREVLWRYSDSKLDQPFYGSAAVTDKYVIIGGRDKQLHCIDRATGEGIWKFRTRAKIDGSPVVVGSRVFVGSSDRNVYAVNIETGEEIWKFNTGGDVTASPAVGEGVLVIGTEGNSAVFCFGKK